MSGAPCMPIACTSGINIRKLPAFFLIRCRCNCRPSLTRRHDRRLSPAGRRRIRGNGDRGRGRLYELASVSPAERPSRLFVDQDLESLRLMAEQLNRSEVLSDFLDRSLQLLDELFGFPHSMILLADEPQRKLFTIASRGYPENGVGSEVGIGEGLIGMVARAGRALRLSAIDHSLRYARAVRDRAQAAAASNAVCREIPLPGLAGAAGQIAVPIVIRSRLIGVLAVESAEPLAFMSREDTILTIVATQLATGIDQLSRDTEESSTNVTPCLRRLVQVSDETRPSPRFPRPEPVRLSRLRRGRPARRWRWATRRSSRPPASRSC